MDSFSRAQRAQVASLLIWWCRSCSPVQHLSRSVSHTKNLLLGGAFVLCRMLAPGTPHCPLKNARYTDFDEYCRLVDHFQMKRSATPFWR
jgi:hypothetical protein